MRAGNKGLILLVSALLLWGVAGHAFYMVDRWNDEPGNRLLTELAAHKKSLAERTPSPRVVVAGGSNAYYGIDTHVMAERLALPVINVALPFEGHNYHINLDLLEGMVRPGDIVVYGSASMWRGSGGISRRARDFDAYLAQVGYPAYERKFQELDLPWKVLPQTNSLLLAFMKRFSEDGDSNRPWTADTDDKGNFTGCVPPPVLSPQLYEDQTTIDESLVEALSETAETLEAEGVRFVLQIPWIFIREDQRGQWQNYLRNSVRKFPSNIPVLDSDIRTLLRSARRDFCDSPFHTSVAATRARSERLAIALAPHIASASVVGGQ